ncbi:unnamed protein product, partial [Prorocentrum cordatum]
SPGLAADCCRPQHCRSRRRPAQQRPAEGRRSPAGRRGRRHGGLSRPLSLSGQGSQRVRGGGSYTDRGIRGWLSFSWRPRQADPSPPNPRLTRPRLSCGAPAVKARRGAGVFKHLGILGASRVPTSPSRGFW